METPMADIIELADQLGKAIADTPAAQDYRRTREHMNAQPDTMKLLQDFMAQSDKMMKATRDNQPIEVDDKHKLNELHQSLVSQEAYKAFSAAQVEYFDLMRKVNEKINSHLSEIEGTAAEPSAEQ